jgi:hypothetical protein
MEELLSGVDQNKWETCRTGLCYFSVCYIMIHPLPAPLVARPSGFTPPWSLLVPTVESGAHRAANSLRIHHYHSRWPEHSNLSQFLARTLGLARPSTRALKHGT